MRARIPTPTLTHTETFTDAGRAISAVDERAAAGEITYNDFILMSKVRVRVRVHSRGAWNFDNLAGNVRPAAYTSLFRPPMKSGNLLTQPGLLFAHPFCSRHVMN